MGSYVLGLVNFFIKKKFYVFKILFQFLISILLLPLLRKNISSTIFENILVLIIGLNFSQLILNVGLNYSGSKKISKVKDTTILIASLSQTRILIAFILSSFSVFYFSDFKLVLYFSIFLFMSSQDQTWFYNFKENYKVQLFGLLTSFSICFILIFISGEFLIFAGIIPLGNFVSSFKINYHSKMFNFKRLTKINLSLSEVYLVASQIIIGFIFSIGILEFASSFNQLSKIDLLLVDRFYNSLSAIGGILFFMIIGELNNNINNKNKILSLLIKIHIPIILLVIFILIVYVLNYNNLLNFLELSYENRYLIPFYSIALLFVAIGPLTTFYLTHKNKEKEIFIWFIFIGLSVLSIAFGLRNIIGIISWPIGIIINGILQLWILKKELKKVE